MYMHSSVYKFDRTLFTNLTGRAKMKAQLAKHGRTRKRTLVLPQTLPVPLVHWGMTELASRLVKCWHEGVCMRNTASGCSVAATGKSTEVEA